MTEGATHHGIRRAREEVAAAALLLEHGYTAQAVSRAFHGAFHAAEAALLVLGETRAGHSDVVSAFVRRVVRERALDPVAGQLVRSLFNRAVLADHGYEAVPRDEADAAVDDARVVVAEVEKWLQDPMRSTVADPAQRATRLPARPPRRRPR